MALLPIDNCTTHAPYGVDTPACTLAIAYDYTTYPSFWTCSRNQDAADQQFCYVVSNHANNSSSNSSTSPSPSDDDQPLLKALRHCCEGGVGGQGTPCIQWCPFSQDLDAFNDCIASNGFEPSHSDEGPLRDTYCVPSLVDQQDHSANVTAANEESNAAPSDQTSAAVAIPGRLQKSGGVMSVLALGLLTARLLLS